MYKKLHITKCFALWAQWPSFFGRSNRKYRNELRKEEEEEQEKNVNKTRRTKKKRKTMK